MGKKLIALLTITLAFSLGSTSFAQIPSADEIYSENGPFMAPLEPDPGIPDTVTAESKVLPSGTTEFTLNVYLYNDEELGGFNLPVTWDSPDITCDSVSFVGTRVEYVNTKLFSIDTVNQRLQAGIIIFFEQYLQPGYGVIYTAYFSVNPGASDQNIVIDSVFYPPGGNFALTLSNGFNIIPQYVQGVVQLGDPQGPVSLLDPTSFNFNAEEGAGNPPAQTLNITNDGSGTLEWSVSNNSGWLSLDPAAGTGDGSVEVSVDITGLSAGTYYDSIFVTSNAENSPQNVPVILVVEPPPPTISLDPITISVTAVEGSSVPPEQITVTNTGGGALNWSATNQTGWLSLDPTGGVGDGVITVEFDLTGLTAGMYYDTVFVTDENATNSPQITVVTLTVEEPPPTILLDPTTITVTAMQGSTPPSEEITITNIGGGELDWTAGNYDTWMSVDPASGVGDGVLTLDFDLSGLAPFTYVDTVVVQDENATNSPQHVIVTLIVESEADPEIGLSHTVFNFNATEGGGNPPAQTLTITNLGGGELDWTATKNEGWLTLNPTSGVGDGTVDVSVDISGLSQGQYIDTILVNDPNAVNSPQAVGVVLNISDFTFGNAIMYPEIQHVIRANAVDPASDTIYIGNFGTTAVSDIDPASILVNGSIVPDSWAILPSHPEFTGEVMELVIAARPFILGYGPLYDTTVQVFTVSGQLNDQTIFEALGEATFIGHLLGDANGDGIVNVGDPVFIMDYIFRDGPAPNPRGIGDVNCDGLTNVGDVRHLFKFIFLDGPEPDCQHWWQ
jgi:hypothetical protein